MDLAERMFVFLSTGTRRCGALGMQRLWCFRRFQGCIWKEAHVMSLPCSRSPLPDSSAANSMRDARSRYALPYAISNRLEILPERSPLESVVVEEGDHLGAVRSPRQKPNLGQSLRQTWGKLSPSQPHLPSNHLSFPFHQYTKRILPAPSSTTASSADIFELSL